MVRHMGLSITLCIVPIFSTSCNTHTKLLDRSNAVPFVHQLLAAQTPKIVEVAEKYQQQLSTCRDRIREPSNGTWNHMDIRLPTDKCPNERWIKLLVIDPKNSDTVYAAGKGLFKSTDAGESWTAINNWSSVIPGETIENQEIRALAINPRNSSEIYMATNHLFKSVDGGNVWAWVDTTDRQDSTQHSSSSYGMNVLIIDSDDPDIIYAGTDRGIIKSMNGGASWTKLMDSWSITTMIVDPQDGNVMYAGDPRGALFKTSNKGKTWDRMQIPDFIGISSLGIDFRDHNTVYAASPAGTVYKTIDGGQHWSTTGYPQFVLTHTLVSDPLYPNTIYAGTLQGLLKSEDGGASWHTDNTGLATTQVNQVPVLALAIDPRRSKSMYAATGTGTFKRIHGGTQ